MASRSGACSPAPRVHGRPPAKAWALPHTEGVAQVKRYAAKLAVCFTYSTNGQDIYGIDMATGAEGDVAGFRSPEVLWA